jgi:hypothetical protein
MFLSMLEAGDLVVITGIRLEGVAVVAPAQSRTDPSPLSSSPREVAARVMSVRHILARMEEMAATLLAQRRRTHAAGGLQALAAHVHGPLDGGSTRLALGPHHIINLSVAEMVTIMFACVAYQMDGPVVVQLVTLKVGKALVVAVADGTVAPVGSCEQHFMAPPVAAGARSCPLAQF